MAKKYCIWKDNSQGTMKVKDSVAFLEENQKDFKVHCGRGSTDTFLPLRLFLQDRTKYMVWQEEQTQKNFQRKYILSLIYWHKDEWIFAGIYESLDVKETPDGPSKYRYTTRLVDVATDLIGKMIVGFKKDFRASYLCLENYIDDLEVLEITRDVCKTVFPGYDKVNVSWEELSGLIETEAWKTALANQKGVYLISDSANGKKYVGSAYGENMILGRWRDYIANGNGGNVELKNIDFKYIQENFRYSILEIFKNTTDDDTILARETWWKEVLMTREFGYNKN